MQIKIEIDVKPEELRRFLGLPDVAGLQDDLVQFLRDKVGQVNENFHPGDFVKGNLDLIKQSPAWKRIVTRLSSVGFGDEEAEEPPQAAPAPKPRRKRSAKAGSTKK
jgi:hypothetical protein